MDEPHSKSLREIFRDLSDEEVEDASQNLDDYLERAWEVFEELAVEKKGKMRKPKKRVDSIYREFDSSQGSARSS